MTPVGTAESVVGTTAVSSFLLSSDPSFSCSSSSRSNFSTSSLPMTFVLSCSDDSSSFSSITASSSMDSASVSFSQVLLCSFVELLFTVDVIVTPLAVAADVVTSVFVFSATDAASVFVSGGNCNGAVVTVVAVATDRDSRPVAAGSDFSKDFAIGIEFVSVVRRSPCCGLSVFKRISSSRREISSIIRSSAWKDSIRDSPTGVEAGSLISELTGISFCQRCCFVKTSTR
mmetsp:Transcript_35827/g.40854  ORF Transcript_35827/g.40854 Transcript_35827/m.40854 type:complete len:230 (-) Transcript_35827:605-1294(-)